MPGDAQPSSTIKIHRSGRWFLKRMPATMLINSRENYFYPGDKKDLRVSPGNVAPGD